MCFIGCGWLRLCACHHANNNAAPSINLPVVYRIISMSRHYYGPRRTLMHQLALIHSLQILSYRHCGYLVNGARQFCYWSPLSVRRVLLYYYLSASPRLCLAVFFYIAVRLLLTPAARAITIQTVNQSFNLFCSGNSWPTDITHTGTLKNNNKKYRKLALVYRIGAY